MESAPPGWYPDAGSPASPTPSTPSLRWWDGARWTDHIASASTPVPALPQAVTTPDGAIVASWGRRLAAWLIDSLITSVVGIAASIWILIPVWRSAIDLVDAVDPVTGELPPGASFTTYFDGFWTQVLLAFAISLAVTLAYHLIFLRWWSSTPGKRLLNLRVRRWEAEGSLTWPTVLKRAGMQYGVFALLSIVYVHLLDGLWPLWDERRQALHDKVASTVVVDVSPADAP